MSTFINYIMMILSEGADFIVSVIGYFNNFVAIVSSLLAIGYGVNPSLTMPLFTMLPVAIVIIGVKFVLKRGK